MATAITAIGAATTGVMVYREIIKIKTGVVAATTTLATWAINAFLIPILELKQQYMTEDIQTVRDAIYSSTLMHNLHQRIDIMEAILNKVDNHIANMDFNLNKKINESNENLNKKIDEYIENFNKNVENFNKIIYENIENIENIKKIAKRDEEHIKEIAEIYRRQKEDILNLIVQFNEKISELENNTLARLPNVPASTNGI